MHLLFFSLGHPNDLVACEREPKRFAVCARLWNVLDQFQGINKQDAAQIYSQHGLTFLDKELMIKDHSGGLADESIPCKVETSV
jgi:hypothetical protein